MDWAFIVKYAPMYVRAAELTLRIAAIGIVLSLVVGALCCIAQRMGSDHLLEFDEGLFTGTVDAITVYKAEKRYKRVVFRFKDGTEITVTV